MIPFNIVALGQFISLEGMELAVKSYSVFYHSVTAKHQKRISMHIIDDTENLKAVTAFCKKHDVEKAAKILELNQQESIEKVYKSASLFFFPIKENRDAIVKESLSYGMPLVGFLKYGYEEYIDQTCGMLLKENADEENVIEFARLLQLLYFDPEARDFLRRGAINKYNATFSWGKSKGSRA